jgi:sugar (pentulose or hexulose) kinase
LGAAVAAGIGVGMFENEGILKKILKEKDVFTPDLESVKKYKKMTSIFVKAYNSLISVFKELSQAGD